jgi:tetratricopeptide (TPR) repeat protein
MKNHLKTFAFIAFALLISSCASTNRMTMGINEPALVHLPSDVKRVGIINRSAPSKGNKVLDKIDKVLSAEGLNLDKKGAEAAISSLSSELSVIKNFEEIKIIKDIEEVKKGLAVLPATLSWELVEKICEENGVDVLFSLAFYDTDTKADYKIITMKLPNSLGIDVDVPAQEVTLATNVVNGWRVYDPHTKEVVDERLYNKNMVFSGKGINPMKAIEAVAGRNETVQEYSRNVGIAYAKRLIPRTRRISRDYFVSGTNNFKIAQRRAQAGDWDGAAQLWEQELSNPDEKIAGRAHYNMAISNEINGDLDKAIQFASKSYTDYRNNIALNYVNVLKYRVRQNRVLDQQLAR